MKNFNNYNNIALSNISGTIIGCNITNCTIENESNTIFERCNITNCTFKSSAKFDRSNIVINNSIPLPEGCIFEKSSITNTDEKQPFDLPFPDIFH